MCLVQRVISSEELQTHNRNNSSNSSTMVLFEDDVFAEELHAAHARGAALAKELGRVREENAELQTKLQKATTSLKSAKVTAREALIEMADQNAKLVQAFVDKKRECKQLKASAREDRKAWQQRLQKMELELQSNNQHIQQLMQQLHAVAARQQAAIPQPDRPSALPCSPPAAQLRSRAAASSGGLSSSSSAGSSKDSRMQDSSTVEFEQGDEVDSSSRRLPQQQQQVLQEASPLGDATNNSSRLSSRGLWRQSSSANCTAKVQGTRSRANAAADENACPSAEQQGWAVSAAPVAGKASQQQQQQRRSVVQAQDVCTQQEQQQEQQQQQQGQLLDVRRQMEELQQRARQLEAENAQLKSAQAAATAQIDSLKLMQQAEQLKQQGNRHFQAQEYKQAAAAYSQALSLGVDDAALAAVLLCNRAASQHATGQYLDAIADCCLAHHLDPKYPRALQRRAEAYMAVQHYGAAVADLQKLLEQAAVGSSKEVAARLASAQAKQRSHGSLGPNHYLVLGLQSSASAAEVKAAYKRLALRHHPDKAARPEAKAAAEAVFVLITAANSVLSDPSMRAAYDAASLRNSLLYGGHSSGSSGQFGRSMSTSSSGGGSMGATAAYTWQHTSSSSTYAAAAEARAAAMAAAAAAAATRSSSHPAPSWQHSGGAFRPSGTAATAAPADSCNSANSTSSCALGATFSRHSAAGVRM